MLLVVVVNELIAVDGEVIGGDADSGDGGVVVVAVVEMYNLITKDN